jgi:DNA-binding MarR family transcriptional regulator
MSQSSLAAEAAQIIDRLDRLVRSGEAQHGLNPVQWEALRYIARANRFSRTPAALADYLGSTRGTISQSLISLEEKGFIARTPSARDKRSVDVDLTVQGRTALAGDPLMDLATDIAASRSADLDTVVALLRETLSRAIARNGGKPFGVCRTCRHFQRLPAGATSYARCTLLDEPLTKDDSAAICAEQEAIAV